MIFRIGGLHYWYVPVINNKNEHVIGIYPDFISTGMDNRTSKDCSLSKILDRDFCSRVFDLSAERNSFDVYRKKFEKTSYSGYIDERMIS